MATEPQNPTQPKPKRAGGMPAYQPNEVDRARVVELARCGVTYEEIRKRIINPRTGAPVDDRTLAKYYSAELELSAMDADAQVIGNLFKKATGDGPQAVQAAMFWAKCRRGWRGTDHIVHEVSGTIAGVMVAPATSTVTDWVAKQSSANEHKKPPTVRGKSKAAS